MQFDGECALKDYSTLNGIGLFAEIHDSNDPTTHIAEIHNSNVDFQCEMSVTIQAAAL